MESKRESQIIRAEPTGLPCGGWYALVHDEPIVKRDGCCRIYPSARAAVNAGWKFLERAMQTMCEAA